MFRPARSSRAPRPGRPSPRAVAVAAGVLCAATATCAVVLIGGNVGLAPAARERLLGASAGAAGLALVLVVTAPLGLVSVEGWRRSPRTGDLAAIAGGALVASGLVQVHVIGGMSWLPAVAFLCGGLLVATGMLMPGSPPAARPAHGRRRRADPDADEG